MRLAHQPVRNHDQPRQQHRGLGGNPGRRRAGTRQIADLGEVAAAQVLPQRAAEIQTHPLGTGRSKEVALQIAAVMGAENLGRAHRRAGVASQPVSEIRQEFNGRVHGGTFVPYQPPRPRIRTQFIADLCPCSRLAHLEAARLADVVCAGQEHGLAPRLGRLQSQSSADHPALRGRQVPVPQLPHHRSRIQPMEQQ